MDSCIDSLMTTVFLGNPGAGKSTLLNSLLGVAPFKSGVSIGHGLTAALQIYIDSQEQRWADTPGLSDPELREVAAKEISKALKLGGDFRICFVCLLDAGRLRPDDKATMSLVIEAAKLGFNEYAIIINKVPPITVQKIETNESENKRLFTMLNEGLPGTQFIILNVLNDKLTDEDNMVVSPSPEVKTLMKEMNWVRIDPETVTDIKADAYEGLLKSLQQQIEKLQQDNSELENSYNGNIAEMQKAHQRQLEQAETLEELRKTLKELEQPQPTTLELEGQINNSYREQYKKQQIKKVDDIETRLQLEKLQSKVDELQKRLTELQTPQIIIREATRKQRKPKGFFAKTGEILVFILSPSKW